MSKRGIVTTIAVGLLISGAIWVIVDNNVLLDKDHVYFIIASVISVVAVLIEGVVSFYSAIKEKEEVKTYYDSIRKSIITGDPGEEEHKDRKNEPTKEQLTDVLELMLANMKEIKEYYVLSKSQARNAFSLAVIMCILGFALLVTAVAATFLDSGNALSTIIPVIGATIVEVIAGTSLFVYKHSLNQLNHYYNSLHNNERFLSVVNMISKISIHKQDDVYIEVIKSQMELMKNKGDEVE